MRLILEKLYKEEILFLDTPEETFPKPWTFETSMISKIELLVFKKMCFYSFKKMSDR